jgi:hypothetical protein
VRVAHTCKHKRHIAQKKRIRARKWVQFCASPFNATCTVAERHTHIQSATHSHLQRRTEQGSVPGNRQECAMVAWVKEASEGRAAHHWLWAKNCHISLLPHAASHKHAILGDHTSQPTPHHQRIKVTARWKLHEGIGHAAGRKKPVCVCVCACVRLRLRERRLTFWPISSTQRRLQKKTSREICCAQAVGARGPQAKQRGARTC